MKILIDSYIPFLTGVLDARAQVQYLPPEAFTPESVRDADALIIRTRTRCDATLLAGSRVRMIATATIGFDHIDTAYCDANGIFWTSCPGCNAMAVCGYVEEALAECAPQARCIGVVGVGHVGSRVVEMARRKGLQVRVSDPPKQLGFPLETLAKECDVITFHTPLTHENPYPTFHLCDESFLRATQPDVLIINAARGGVVDEKALISSGRKCVIDCWENEPHLYSPMVEYALRATCHIAGYSIEGKKNASQMCLDAVSRYFDLPAMTIREDLTPERGDSAFGWLQRLSDKLKAQPQHFEQIRKNYILR